MMPLVFAAITLTWTSGLCFVAAVIFAVIFVMGAAAPARTWNIEALAFCLLSIAATLFTAGVH